MRQIVLDTETTGIDPMDGHRIVEIGAVEIHNYMPTGKNLQLYINPEREVPPEAVAVHGLDNKFLDDKPTFGEVVGEFMDFVRGDKIVAHNAEFDVKFLNYELRAFGFPPFRDKNVIDTLAIARKKFPGSPASLDALCSRFGIDNSNRTLHGALLDSEILAEIYLELTGGRQHGMMLDEKAGADMQEAGPGNIRKRSDVLKPRQFSIPIQEQEAHRKMIENDLHDPVWNKLSSVKGKD